MIYAATGNAGPAFGDQPRRANQIYTTVRRSEQHERAGFSPSPGSQSFFEDSGPASCSMILRSSPHPMLTTGCPHQAAARPRRPRRRACPSSVWLQSPERQAVFVVCGQCSDCLDSELERRIVGQVNGAAPIAAAPPTADISQPPMAAADPVPAKWVTRAAAKWVEPLSRPPAA